MAGESFCAFSKKRQNIALLKWTYHKTKINWSVKNDSMDLHSWIWLVHQDLHHEVKEHKFLMENSRKTDGSTRRVEYQSQDHAKDAQQQISWTWTTVFFHSKQEPFGMSLPPSSQLLQREPSIRPGKDNRVKIPGKLIWIGLPGRTTMCSEGIAQHWLH